MSFSFFCALDFLKLEYINQSINPRAKKKVKKYLNPITICQTRGFVKRILLQHSSAVTNASQSDITHIMRTTIMMSLCPLLITTY